MKPVSRLLFIAVFTLLFTWLFYRHSTGLNLFLYEMAVMAVLVAGKEIRLKGLLNVTILSGTFITALFILLFNTGFTIAVNIISFILLIGLLAYPSARSLPALLPASLNSMALSFTGLFDEVNSLKSGGFKAVRYIRMLRIFIIPLAVILLFLGLYTSANPVFSDMVEWMGEWTGRVFEWLYDHINMVLFLTIVLGFIAALFIFIHKKPGKFIAWDQYSQDIIDRTRSGRGISRSMTGLKNEYRAALFLLIVLNLMIFTLNIIDIRYVWFGFEWEGQYLKKFVHEGTYLLIVSILISIVIVLYFFRRNMNFYPKNKWLKVLSYAWLAQNAFLALSVGIRNYRYIEYFGLAYKRIGVVFFLLLVLYGIYTVYKKVKYRYSAYYLLRKNSLALYTVIVFAALFNWDVIIAKYNFRHYERSFVHLEFMATLSDASLPWLDHSMEELERVNAAQQDKFSFRSHYMSIDEYHRRVNERKQSFLEDYTTRDWKEWNYADWRAYHRLLKK